MQGLEKIALIFFSRSAASEAKAKPWLGKGNAANSLLANILHAKAVETIRQSGFEVLTFDEGRQRGHSFGEKLANAFADTFALGYSAAVAIGNDSPDLDKTDWQQVKMAMLGGKQVLGPNFRGGSYLIGLQAKGFDAKIFAALPWQTSKLWQALKTSLGDVLQLQQLRDINSLHDLLLAIKGRNNACFRAIRSLLQKENKNNQPIPFLPNQAFHFSLQVRPPPCC